MPGEDVRVNGYVTIPERELAWRFSRSSKPGGQSVNTTDSRAELLWNLETTTALSTTLRDRARERLAGHRVDGVVVIAASEFKSQLRNRDAARDRLAALVAAAIAPPPPKRRRTKPTRAAVQRRLDAKRARSQLKRLRRPPP